MGHFYLFICGKQTVMGCMSDWYTTVCGICSCSVVANRLSWAERENCIQLCMGYEAVKLLETDCHALHDRLAYSCVCGSVAVQLW